MLDDDGYTRLRSQSHSGPGLSPFVPCNRTRSQSTSSLAAEWLETVNFKIKEIEEADTTGLLRFVDDQVHDTWDSVKRAALVGSQRLLQFHELPAEWQENEYVLSGYRFYQSHRDCLRSIFKAHNETMNIWSHLLGFVFMTGLSIYGFNRHFPDAVLGDRVVLMVFCLAALVCLLSSSIYHTFICHSHHPVKSFTATLDYIGIAILITASTLVMEYYSFYCQPAAQTRYMIFTSAVGCVGVVAPFLKSWDTPECRPLRITIFLSMATSAVVPIIHLVHLNGLQATWTFFHMCIVSIVMYLLGVVVYVHRFPERFFPGRFDSIGMTSHAIWHVFVCLGIYFHYHASLHFYAHRVSYGCTV